jgi:hypothetical protein
MKTKSEARYTDKSPYTSYACRNCDMFRKPQRCTLVRGVIRAPGWCRYWESKTNEHASSVRQAAT